MTKKKAKKVWMTIGVKLPVEVFAILQQEAKDNGVSLSKGISAWITKAVVDDELRKAKEAEQEVVEK